MIKYIILGIVQGFTEFLPVSSSGHLVLLQDFFGVKEGQLTLDIVLHLGTLSAVAIFFLKDIRDILTKNLKTVGYLIWVTIITGTIGILGKDFFESLFESSKFIFVPFAVTGIVLLLTKKFAGQTRMMSEINIKDSSIFGIAQGLAIVPGISRSGFTISSLLFRGIKPEAAFTFSFLASIPAIMGATILEARRITEFSAFQSGYLIAGFFSAFLSGIAALFIFRSIVRKAKISVFGFYCLAVALFSIIANFFWH